MPQLALLPLSLCPVPVTVQAEVRVGVPVPVPVSVRVQKKAAPFGQGYQLRFIDVLIVISACGSVAAAAACWFLSAWCLLWLPLHVVCRLYIPYRI